MEVRIGEDAVLAMEMGSQLRALTEIWWRIIIPQVQERNYSAQRQAASAALLIPTGTNMHLSFGEQMNAISYTIAESSAVDLAQIRKFLGWISTSVSDARLQDAIRSMGGITVVAAHSLEDKPRPESINLHATAGLHAEECLNGMHPGWYGVDRNTLDTLRLGRVLLLNRPSDVLAVRAAGCQIASLCPDGGVMSLRHWLDIPMVRRVHTLAFQEEAEWLTDEMPKRLEVRYHGTGCPAPAIALKTPREASMLRRILKKMDQNM